MAHMVGDQDRVHGKWVIISGDPTWDHKFRGLAYGASQAWPILLSLEACKENRVYLCEGSRVGKMVHVGRQYKQKYMYSTTTGILSTGFSLNPNHLAILDMTDSGLP